MNWQPSFVRHLIHPVAPRVVQRPLHMQSVMPVLFHCTNPESKVAKKLVKGLQRRRVHHVLLMNPIKHLPFGNRHCTVWWSTVQRTASFVVAELVD